MTGLPSQNERPIRVGFVSHAAELGGAERALLECIEDLQGGDFEFYATTPRDGPLVSALRTLGVTVATFHYATWTDQAPNLKNRVWRNLKNFFGFACLDQQIRRWNLDCVITNTITTPIGAMAAATTGRPHIWFLHEFGDFKFDFGKPLSSRLVGRFSAAVMVNSEALRDYFSPYLGETPVSVAYQSARLFSVEGQEGEAEPQWNPHCRLRCLSVGSVQASKGQEDAIRAVAELHKEGVHLDLRFLGPALPDYLEQLKALTEELGIGEWITFHGEVPNPEAFYTSADCLLNCSRSEAFGRVTVEAMRYGLAVVATNNGGTIELVEDSVRGLLYSPGDTEHLSRHLRTLVESPDLREQLAQAGQTWVKSSLPPGILGKTVARVVKYAIDAASSGVIPKSVSR